MTAALNALQSQLKMDPKLSAIANEGKKKGDRKDKKKNKKNTYNQREQKKDEAWKKEPPKDGEKGEKEVGKYMHHWCEHHMAWTMHKPSDCLLGKQHKEDQKKEATEGGCQLRYLCCCRCDGSEPSICHPHGLNC
jgi:hypothetical protein